MSRKRQRISKEIKIASLLLEVWSMRGCGIPFREAQAMTAKSICAEAEWDHGVWHSSGGSIHPTNLTARRKADHRRKTAKVDIPAIAKSKRVSRKHHAHLAVMAEKLIPINVTGALGVGCKDGCTMSRCAHTRDGHCARLRSRKRQWPSRKIPSRPFAKRRRKS